MAKVEIYTKSTCPYCMRAKALLAQKSVKFIEFDIGGNTALRHEMISRSNGGSTVPQIFINNTHIGGCDDLFALEYKGQLNALLQ